MSKRIKGPFFPAELRAAMQRERDRREASAEWAAAAQLAADAGNPVEALPAALLMARCAAVELEAVRQGGNSAGTGSTTSAHRASQRRRLQDLTQVEDTR